MNSRKKRFWKLWQKRNEDIAMTNVEKANKISNVNYTVSLKPYTHISFKNNKHIQDIYFEDESIILFV